MNELDENQKKNENLFNDCICLYKDLGMAIDAWNKLYIHTVYILYVCM